MCSIATSKSGFASYQEDVKKQVNQLVEHLKVSDAAIASGFVSDLLRRGKISVSKKFNPGMTKSQNSDLLNPANLGFFVQLIQDKGLIASDKKTHMSRVLYDLIIAFAFAYHDNEDSLTS